MCTRKYNKFRVYNLDVILAAKKAVLIRSTNKHSLQLEIPPRPVSVLWNIIRTKENFEIILDCFSHILYKNDRLKKSAKLICMQVLVFLID